MKRILATCAAVAIALAAWCQLDDSTTLSQQQWQHALAIVAQTNVLNDGYGQPTGDFEARSPEGYTLDDLNTAYKGKRNWDDMYRDLKSRENDGGTVGDVKKLAGGLAVNVESQLKKYLEAQPAPHATAAVQIDTLADENVPPVQQLPDEEQQAEPSQGGGDAMHIVAYVLMALLALAAIAAIVIACSTRRSLIRLRDNYIEDIEALNQNLQDFADSLAQEVDALKAQLRAERAQPERHHAPAATAPAPAPQAPAPQPVKAKTYYLGKPDEKEVFTRFTEDFELGNSIFALTTQDGRNGVFSVIENSDVHRFALMMPSENLTRACSGNGIQMSGGRTRIITDREGEAQLIDGQWHVIVKAIIHYE